MAAKETIRLNIDNLLPDEKYVVQVRAVGGGDESEWSQKLHFTTVDDKTGTGGPSIPQNVAWVQTEEAIVAEWDAVGSGAGNTKIDKYEVEVSGGAVVNQSAHQPSESPRQAKPYSVANIYSIFQGAIPDNVSLRVRTVNSAGTRSDWSETAVIAIGKPDPPTEAVPPPTAKGVIDAVALNWTPPANPMNVAGYRVYVSLNPNFTANGTNRIYQGAAPSHAMNSSTYQTHYFKIRAYSLFGKESDDLLAEAAPRSPFGSDWIPSPPPTNIQASLVRDGTAAKGVLTWDWTDDDEFDTPATHFSIRYRKVGTSIWSLVNAPIETRTGQFDLASPYADYEAQISTVDAVGNYSDYSPASPVTVAGGIPGPPPQVTGVTVSSNMLDGVTLKWTESAALDVVDGGHYNVQFATNTGFTTGLIEYNTGNTQISVSGLQPATIYYYRVQAVDNSGAAGAWSATGNVTTANFPTVKSDGVAPPAVGTVTVTPGIGYLSVTWPAVTNNDAVTYEVHMSTTSGFTPAANTLVAQGNSTMQIIRVTAAKAPLVYDTTYYVKVIAKDVDGAAAASAQASGAPVKGSTFDIEELSIEKIVGGNISGEEFVIATGGSLRTSNSDVVITSSGIQVGPNSTVSAAAMQAGTAFVEDLTVSSKFTLVGSNAYIQSSNYSAVGDGAGFQIHAGGIDIRSGVIWANVLKGGTVTAATINIGTGGVLNIDQTGIIKSNNYSATQGWRITNTGIEMNDSASSIKASAIKGGSFSGGEFIVASGGSIRSTDYSTTAGWKLDYQGLTINAGTIKGATVETDQLYSSQTVEDGAGGTRRTFDINAGGYAIFTGARIYGNTIVSNHAQHRLQTDGWVSGGGGWKIGGDGNAEFGNLRVGGGGKDYIYATSEIPGDGRAYLRFINGSDGSIKGDLKTWGNGLELAARFGPSLQIDGGNCTVNGGGLVVSGGIYTGGGVITGHGGLRTNADLVVGTNITAGHNLWAKYQAGSGPRYAVFYSDGQLAAAGAYSSEKVKRNIEPLPIDPVKVLQLEPVVFHYNTQESDDEDKFNGFIAERAHELGLTNWINYDENGEPEAFDYPMFVTALQAVNRYQQQQIEDLKSRLNYLEASLDN